jgi:hypothetical protein
MSSNPESEPTRNDTAAHAAAVVGHENPVEGHDDDRPDCSIQDIDNIYDPTVIDPREDTAAKTGQDAESADTNSDDGQSNMRRTKYAVLGAGATTTFAEATDSASETTVTVTSTVVTPTNVTSNTGSEGIKDGVGGVGMAAKMEALLPDTEVINDNDVSAATLNMLPSLEHHRATNLEEPTHVFADALVMDDSNRPSAALPVQSVQPDTVTATIDTGFIMPPPSSSSSQPNNKIIWGIVAVLIVTMASILGGVCGSGSGCVRRTKDSKPSNEANTEPPPPPPSAEALAMAAFINNITLTGRTIELLEPVDFSNPKTIPPDVPTEELALQWLIQFNAQLQLSPDSESEREQLQQRYALATLWVNNTDFTNFTFGSADHECEWGGIICSNVDGHMDSEEHANSTNSTVTQIELRENRWKARLSDDLGLLSHVVYFDMSDNFLTGSLPTALAYWTDLKVLNTGTNDFLPGTLPDWIGQWTNLEFFNVGSNSLRGTLPDSMAMWTNLRYFSIYNNKVTGTLPDFIGNWTNLEHFEIDTNLINGTLPDSIGQWTNLLLFDIGPTQLSGTLPDSMANWKRIGLAAFDSTDLTGTVPNFTCSWNNPSFVTADCDEIKCDCCKRCFYSNN